MKLFGIFCDHVNQRVAPYINSSESLWEQIKVLAPEKGTSEESMLRLPRYRALYKGFGNGYPRSIIARAKVMSSEDSVAEYLRYICLRFYQDLDTKQCRCALLCHKLELLMEVHEHLQSKRYQKAKELQIRLGTVSLVLEEYPPISTLMEELESVRQQAFHATPFNLSSIELMETKDKIEAQVHRATTFIVNRNEKSYSVKLEVGFCSKTEMDLELRLGRSEELVMRIHLLEGHGKLSSKVDCILLSVLKTKLTEDFEVMLHLQSITNRGLDAKLEEARFAAYARAARNIQAMARLYLARSRVISIRQTAAGVRIQRWMRNYFWIKSITRVQARMRGVLHRIGKKRESRDPFLRARSLLSKSFRRLRCRREVARWDMVDSTENLSQSATSAAVSNDMKKDFDSLLGSIHTATTMPLSELSTSADRSIRSGVDFMRNVNFCVKDRWDTGVPPREVQLSKTYGERWVGDDDSSQAIGVRRSRWLTGTHKHEFLIPKQFFPFKS